MSTQKQSTNQYAPAGMAAYNQMTPQAASNMTQFMNNPLQSSFFQSNLGIANKNTAQQGSTQMQTLLNNMKANMGTSSQSSPFFQSQTAQQGRFNSGQQQNNFMSLLNNANQLRMGATQGALGYQPLQTGNTQTTSGLGTWLPQLAGGALGALSGMGGMGGAASASQVANSPFIPSMSAFTPSPGQIPISGLNYNAGGGSNPFGFQY